jgi:superfamily II DNA or RNA helicase
MLALRDYQTAIVDGLRSELRAGKRRLVAVAPTGAGKTVIASHIMASAAAKGSRVLFLAHRAELIDQCSRKLDACGVAHGRIVAGGSYDGQAVQVASIPTLARRKDVPGADLVVVDECHHVCAKSWASVVKRYDRAALLGLTATPFRLDGRGLKEHFDALVARVGIQDLIAMGHLVPPVVYTQPGPDLRGVRRVGGDFAQGQLATRVDQPRLVGDVVRHWARLALDRTTVAFCCTVQHAEHVAAAFSAAGIPAASVDGATPAAEREGRLADLASGKIKVLTNVAILTEGWDLPRCGAVILARPTQSRALYLQMVGRGLRTDAGKDDCLVLDHAGNTLRHGFVTDPIAYSLEGLEAQGAAPSVRLCPQCAAALKAGTQTCPLCGYAFPPPDEDDQVPEAAAGELERVDPSALRPVADESEKRRAMNRLRAEAKSNGYKATWAHIKFKAIYGHWPSAALLRGGPERQAVAS